ncbi:hypothetical protein WA026_018658 [Henosepilachna vigintioctopunctata]|uniref:Chitin-binding type-2 domain-containing protein n=1 Tax=Henosepilachna vigintioctopunctata TaxID=420089 RepID=A0AAW1UA14_9CUCU
MIYIGVLLLSLAISAHASLEPCDVVGQLKADPIYCDQFYQCTNKGWEMIICPFGLYFNPKISVCDWPDDVPCGNNNENYSNTKLEPCEIIGEMKGESKNCQQYYVCTEEGWLSHECRAPLLFNSISKICEHSVNVNCAK